MRSSTPERLCDLCKNLVVKLVVVILGVYSPLNNHDIEGMLACQIFALLLPFMLHALLISMGSIPGAYFPFEPSGC